MRVAKIALAALVVVGAAGITGYALLHRTGQGTGAQYAAAAQQGKGFVMPVPVAIVVKKTVPIHLDYVGTTEAIRSVALQAKVTGFLAERGAPDGADVKQGDLLYRINPRDYQAALDQAKAQAQRDAAALTYARSNLKRGDSLVKEGWVTKDSYDQRSSTEQQAIATLAADEAAIQTAQLNLSYTDIRAPFSGRLGRSLVHEGALISAAGTQFNTLVQLDPIYVTFNPSETDLVQIEKRRAAGEIPATVTLTGDSKPRLGGTLTFLDNTVDRATGTIVARATIDNTDHTLIPGQYVQVRLQMADQADALLVPQAAVGSSQLGKFVYVVGDGGTVEQHYITLGPTDGDLVVVSSGVKPNDRIIVGNLQKIGPGMPVQPMSAQGKAGT